MGPSNRIELLFSDYKTEVIIRYTNSANLAARRGIEPRPEDRQSTVLAVILTGHVN